MTFSDWPTAFGLRSRGVTRPALSSQGIGAGIALMPELICRPWFERGALVRIDGFEQPGEESYYLVTRRDDVERPEVRAFTRWLIEQFQVPA